MVLELLVIAGVALVALPALAVGLLGLTRRFGHYSTDVTADRASLALLLAARLVVLLLVLVLSGLVLVSAVGAMIRGLELHGMVPVLTVLDLLLALLVLLTFGRRDPRRARRRANPAAR